MQLPDRPRLDRPAGPAGALTRHLPATSLAVSALLSLTGCAFQGVNLVQDNRVEITQPRDRAEVTLPVTVRWTYKDLKIVGDTAAGKDAVQFAVFIDRAPMPRGKDVRWLARDDQVCRHVPTCPDAEWLRARNIAVQAATTMVIDAIPDNRRNKRGADQHEVTIVLLDAAGRRTGESSFSVEFSVRRDS
ncbi:MAG: hypothetical protein QOE05_311 [Actinomycetota bacterium]|jgi:hypothetical protein|nr:hypothetical protein [Actinomycetota bacterium]